MPYQKKSHYLFIGREGLLNWSESLMFSRDVLHTQGQLYYLLFINTFSMNLNTEKNISASGIFLRSIYRYKPYRVFPWGI